MVRFKKFGILLPLFLLLLTTLLQQLVKGELSSETVQEGMNQEFNVQFDTLHRMNRDCKPSLCPQFCGSKAGSSNRYVRSGSTPPLVTDPDWIEYPMATLLEEANSLGTFPPIVTHTTLTFREQKVFVFRVDNPLHHVHFLPPAADRCPGLNTTSQTSSVGSCVVAMNAGFFNRGTGDCVGNLYSYGQRIQLSGLRNTNFGITKDGRYVVGYLSQDQLLHDFEFAELVSGMLWLVRNGTVYYCESYNLERPSSWFLDQVAPRSFIGLDKDGRFFMILVEGESKTQKGLTIFDTADLALHLGLVEAVNLDGGGSSTIVYNDVVRNVPSDTCGSQKHCERLVTSAVCVN